MTDISWPRRNASPFATGRLRVAGRAEALLAVAGIGAWILDPATESLWWSDDTCRIHGVGADFVPTLAAAIAFYTPEARETVTAALARSVATGAPWDSNCR